jgi:hypothetical protein
MQPRDNCKQEKWLWFCFRTPRLGVAICFRGSCVIPVWPRVSFILSSNKLNHAEGAIDPTSLEGNESRAGKNNEGKNERSQAMAAKGALLLLHPSCYTTTLLQQETSSMPAIVHFAPGECGVISHQRVSPNPTNILGCGFRYQITRQVTRWGSKISLFLLEMTTKLVDSDVGAGPFFPRVSLPKPNLVIFVSFLQT